MRVLKTVLLSSLLSTAAFAAVPQNFGLLRPQTTWTVGTVAAQGGSDSYCAMVGQYDSGTVLAFSRGSDGRGSIAVDYHRDIFNPGASYNVSLKVDDKSPRKISARANSSHSLVIPTGADNTFYSALSEDGNLDINVEGVAATFAMRKFSASYPQLLDCSAAMYNDGPKVAAAPVTKVEKSVLPLSEEQASRALERERQRVADMGAQIERLQAKLNSRADYGKLQNRVAEEARAQQDTASEKISDLDKTRTALASQLGARKSEVEEMERTLGVKDGEIAEVQASSDSPNDEAVLAKVAQLQKERDALSANLESARKTVSAGEKMAASQKTDLSAKLADLGRRLFETEAQRDEARKRLAEEQTRNAQAQAQAVQLQKQIADLTVQRNEISVRVEAQEKQNKVLAAALTAKEQELTVARASGKKLNSVQAELSALQSGTTQQATAQKAQAEELQKKIDGLMAENAALKAGKDQTLAAVTQERQRMEEQLAAQSKQAAADRAAMENQLKAAVAAGRTVDGKTLAQLQNDLEDMRNAQDVARTTLQKQLDDKTAQVAALQKQVEENSKNLPVTFKTAAELAAKKDEMAALEKKLSDVEAQLATATAQLGQKSDVEAKLSSLAQEKQDITLRLDVQEKQNKVLEAALSAKEQSRQTADAEGQKLIADLNAKLSDKTAQFDALQQQVQKLGSEAETKSSAELTARKSDVARLEKQLALVDTERKAAVEQMRKAQAEAEAAQRQVAALSNDLQSGRAQIATLQDNVTRQKTALGVTAEPIRAVVSEAAPRIDGKPATQVVAAEKVELDQAKTRIKALEKQLADSQTRVKELSSVPTETVGGVTLKTAAVDVPVQLAPPQQKPLLERVMAEQKPSGTYTLQSLLASSGVNGRVMPVDDAHNAVVSQWTSGKVSGMYERIPGGADFDRLAADYIDRYREDCGSGLKVRMSPSENARAGTVAAVDIECAAPGNSYASSIAFLRDGSGFSTFLHTAMPSDRAQVGRIRDAILSNLRTASFSAPQVVGTAATAQQPLKLNIPSTSSGAAPATPPSDIATVVVQ